MAVLLLVMSIVPAHASSGNDSDDNDAVIDERWGLPILAYGSALNDEQKDTVLAHLDLTDRQFDSVYVTGQDMVRFLGSGNPNAQMFSSALITRQSAGFGIIVDIVTPDNITHVTATQYANAMITAGVTDALVEVAAPFPVTGEAALTGIYKAFYERGEELDEDRMAVAQEQLEVTSSISNYHDDNDDFDPYVLDQVMLDILAQLVALYDRTNELATREDIESIVREVLAESDIEGVLTEGQIGSIVGFTANFQETDAIRSEDFRTQLSVAGDRLADMISGILPNVDTGWFSNLLSSIGDFFVGIWEWVMGLFDSTDDNGDDVDDEVEEYETEEPTDADETDDLDELEVDDVDDTEEPNDDIEDDVDQEETGDEGADEEPEDDDESDD